MMVVKSEESTLALDPVTYTFAPLARMLFTTFSQPFTNWTSSMSTYVSSECMDSVMKRCISRSDVMVKLSFSMSTYTTSSPSDSSVLRNCDRMVDFPDLRTPVTIFTRSGRSRNESNFSMYSRRTSSLMVGDGLRTI